MARYTLSMPEEIMLALKKRAKQQECNVKDVVRQALTIGLKVADISEKGGRLIIDENGKQREIILVL